MRNRWAVTVAAFLIVLVAGEGCGSPKTFPVTGKVVFGDGKAAVELAGGTVMCDQVDGKVSARGQIEPDGTFRLGTLKTGDGAPPGRYRAVVVPPLEQQGLGDESAAGKQRAVMDPRFQDPDKSKLEIVVEPRSNEVTLRVERIKR